MLTYAKSDADLINISAVVSRKRRRSLCFGLSCTDFWYSTKENIKDLGK